MSWLWKQKGEKSGEGMEVRYLWKHLVGQGQEIRFQEGKDNIQ